MWLFFSSRYLTRQRPTLWVCVRPGPPNLICLLGMRRLNWTFGWRHCSLSGRLKNQINWKIREHWTFCLLNCWSKPPEVTYKDTPMLHGNEITYNLCAHTHALAHTHTHLYGTCPPAPDAHCHTWTELRLHNTSTCCRLTLCPETTFTYLHTWEGLPGATGVRTRGFLRWKMWSDRNPFPL